MKRVLLALALAAGSAAALAQDRPAAVAVQTDWSQRIERTAQGGYRMGNPDAPVKLVEFLSLTCDHCATFSAQGMPALVRDHVRSGRASIEYRNFVLNTYDVAASVLSRCVAPDHYFALTSDLLARQSSWVGRIDALTPDQRRQLEAFPTPAGVARIVDALGLKEIVAAHGVTPAMAQSCLADAAGLDQVLAMRNAADRLGVQGTPTFLVNDRLVGPHDWASLQPLLAQP